MGVRLSVAVCDVLSTTYEFISARFIVNRYVYLPGSE
jgi:hypothetical protein